MACTIRNKRTMDAQVDEQTCRLCTSQGANYTPIFRKSDGDVVKMIRCLPVQVGIIITHLIVIDNHLFFIRILNNL